VKKLLLNCDQVFEVLTRGPFPTGDPSDEAVEYHLRACHECRQLAEALRPAVELMHEAVVGDQAMELPEYHGSLPEARTRQASASSTRSLTHGVRRLGTRPRAVAASINYKWFANAVRLLAASILVAALGTFLYGVMMSSGGGQRFVAERPLPNRPQLSELLPDEHGLITLASLQLPGKCFPKTYELSSPEHAAVLIARMADGSLAALRCCTECHRAGAEMVANTQLVANRAKDSCVACHRG
jgi:hypothetical protein